MRSSKMHIHVAADRIAALKSTSGHSRCRRQRAFLWRLNDWSRSIIRYRLESPPPPCEQVPINPSSLQNDSEELKGGEAFLRWRRALLFAFQLLLWQLCSALHSLDDARACAATPVRVWPRSRRRFRRSSRSRAHQAGSRGRGRRLWLPSLDSARRTRCTTR